MGQREVDSAPFRSVEVIHEAHAKGDPRKFDRACWPQGIQQESDKSVLVD